MGATLVLLCFGAFAAQPDGSALPWETLSNRQLVERLVAQADAGDSPAALAQAVGERGIAAVLVAAEFLDERKPRRAQPLYEAIAVAGTGRRSHPEVLRLYQPEALQLFYATNGLAAQRRLAVGLDWKEWPAALPEAAVRAAPLPTLEWLRAQATSAAPALDKLRLLARPLGWWLRAHHERQHTHAFHEAIAALAENPALVRDLPTRAALLQLIADAGATGSLGFVLQQLGAPKPETRADAVAALGQLLNPQSHACGRGCGPADAATWGRLVAARTRAMTEFVRLSVEETDASVLTKLAAAAEAWPEEDRVGQAMLDLFARTTNAGVRRAILFSVMNTRWPQRGRIILRAFDAPGEGVLGVALQSVAAHPLPEVAPRTLAMLDGYAEAQPHLIDAMGALSDARATPQLLRWLGRERNLAVRLKLAQALEKIPGEVSGRALTEMLAREAEPLLGEHLCRIASRRELPGAAAVLAALAEDATAPMVVRGQAVWALGRYPEPAARECLARLRREPEKFFSVASGQMSAADTVEQARLFLTLTALRQGEPGMEEELTRRFAAGSPTTQLTCLFALAEMKRDHPVIAMGLDSGDFAVLLGAVKAAGAAAPAKYHARLLALRDAPFVAALLAAGLDTWGLPAALDGAIREGEKSK